jgi:class 3 adenylate cyclase
MDDTRQIGGDCFDDEEGGESALVGPKVIREMLRTPVSLRDDRYDKGYVEALSLCMDLRGFSSYALVADRDAMTGFLEKYSQELLAAVNSYSASYYKLLGDGAIVIWDRPDDYSAEACLDVFRLLRDVVDEIAAAYRSPCALAGAITLDTLYKYEIFGECSGLKYRDYVGYGINIAFRLQSLAGPGELLASPAANERFALGAPLLAPERRPPRGSIKGIRDEDREGIVVVERR